MKKRIRFNKLTDAIEFYFRLESSDGLPVVPPTAETVKSFLDYVGRRPSDILGEEPTKNRVITVEKAAINAVMAGCLPEYFPVVLAATEAICEPQFNLHAATVSTQGAAILAVINGPIVKELGINSGVNVFGPGHRSNATIGRSIRLIVMNVTGAVPGILDKAALGHPGKYSWCIAEAENESPWESLHVERGLSESQSSVTVFPGLSAIPVSHQVKDGQPESILAGLCAGMLVAGPNEKELVIVITPETVGHIRSAGWSKTEMKNLLFKTSQRPLSNWIRTGAVLDRSIDANTIRSVVSHPEGITMIVAGGQAGTVSHIIPLWGGGSNASSVIKEIVT